MALALARSFLRHNSAHEISFSLVTDQPIKKRPQDLADIDWVTIPEGAYGSGFMPKLHLDHLAPASKSLFIDADCLCVGSVAPAFNAFAGHAVSVVGRRLTEGEWFGDVAAIRAAFGVTGYPRFNGGVYYIERGSQATAIYETARKIVKRYDEVGFVRLRGSANDEVVMAVAMELHGQDAVPEDGTIMHTALEAPGGVFLDVIRGRSLLRNPSDHPKHFSWLPLEVMRPAIVHFLGTNADEHPYRTEIEALALLARGWPPVAARAYVNTFFAVPSMGKRLLKNLLRPLYRVLFGVRPVHPNSR